MDRILLPPGVDQRWLETPAGRLRVLHAGGGALNRALEHPTDVSALVLITPGGLMPVVRNRGVQFLAWAMAQLPDPVLLPLLGRSGKRNDLTDRVHEIAVPTLVFHGEDDPIVDPAGSRRAADRMPHARLILVRDCGHWGQLEQHDRFLAEVRAFLGGLE